MMKKLLFLVAGGALSFSAMAQKAFNQSLVMTPKNSQAVEKKYSVEEMRKLTSFGSKAASKGTISGTRTYNYIELLSLLNTPAQSLPYMWQNGEGMGVYSTQTGGFENDTIRYMGFGAVLHPAYESFNDPFALDYAGKVAVKTNNAYTVDTVAVYGIYGQNSGKASVVDTLVVTLVYGTDITISRWWSNDGSFRTNFGSDTLAIPNVRFDSAAYAPVGANRIVKKIALDANWKNDTLANGIHRFAVPFGTTVPAGQLAGAFVSFVSGDPNKPAPYADTIFRGNVAPGLEAFKYNMFRPMMYGERDNAYPRYIANNYNTGYGLERIMDITHSLYKTYIPHYFWGQAANVEHPYMDWVVSCTNCDPVNVTGAVAQNAEVKVYPNPATSEAKVSFKLTNASDVTVSMTNLMGQTIGKQQFAAATSGQASFSTSNLPNGIYLINIDADGYSKVERFAVSH